MKMRGGTHRFQAPRHGRQLRCLVSRVVVDGQSVDKGTASWASFVQTKIGYLSVLGDLRSNPWPPGEDRRVFYKILASLVKNTQSEGKEMGESCFAHTPNRLNLFRGSKCSFLTSVIPFSPALEGLSIKSEQPNTAIP